MPDRKENAPHLREGQPGSAQAGKADASYRNAPHTFRADTGPDGTVTLTVQQNYTGKRQWFRFDPDQWSRLVSQAGEDGHQAAVLAHEHRYEGQLLRHAHKRGKLPHGYFEHPEDSPHDQNE